MQCGMLSRADILLSHADNIYSHAEDAENAEWAAIRLKALGTADCIVPLRQGDEQNGALAKWSGGGMITMD